MDEGSGSKSLSTDSAALRCNRREGRAPTTSNDSSRNLKPIHSTQPNSANIENIKKNVQMNKASGKLNIRLINRPTNTRELKKKEEEQV